MKEMFGHKSIKVRNFSSKQFFGHASHLFIFVQRDTIDTLDQDIADSEAILDEFWFMVDETNRNDGWLAISVTDLESQVELAEQMLTDDPPSVCNSELSAFLQV